MGRYKDIAHKPAWNCKLHLIVQIPPFLLTEDKIKDKNTSGKSIFSPVVPPQSPIYLMCAALFSQPEFISSEAIRALWLSAHQIQLIDDTNPGAGPRHHVEKNYNIFLNDLSPFHFRAVINMEQSIGCIADRPRRDENAATGRTRLPQQEPARLRHASPLNMVLKRNWLHLNRHSDQSRQHLADGESRHPGPEHHLLAYAFRPGVIAQ